MCLDRTVLLGEHEFPDFFVLEDRLKIIIALALMQF